MIITTRLITKGLITEKRSLKQKNVIYNRRTWFITGWLLTWFITEKRGLKQGGY